MPTAAARSLARRSALARPARPAAHVGPRRRARALLTIRRRVADHRHSDAWVEEGLHFLVFRPHLAARAGPGPAGAHGGAPGSSAAPAPLAVFAMHLASSTLHAAAVVTPGPEGAAAEIRDLRAPG